MPIPYRKPFLDYPDQLELLKSRNLKIRNTKKATHLLKKVSYYRLSGYWYPLLEDKEQHNFKKGADFDTAFKLYCFDRELRKMVISELEKIEVAIRSAISHEYSLTHGGFWFLNTNHFKDTGSHSKSITGLTKEFNRSDEEFIKSFKNKYSDSLPPSFMLFEISTFGTLSILYSNLKPSIEKRNIAKRFGLTEKVFSSWLHCLCYIRNVCAHHSRLWNRVMSIQPKIPTGRTNQWLTNPYNNQRVFMVLSMIIYYLNIVNPHHSFQLRFNMLLSKYRNVDKKAMGFPDNWEKEALWRNIHKRHAIRKTVLIITTNFRSLINLIFRIN